MNTIIIEGDSIKECSCKKNIKVDFSLKNEDFTVNVLTIHIKEDTKLLINAKQEDCKLKINYIIDPYIKAEILDLRKINGLKMAEEIHLNEKSELKIIKFYEGKNVKKQDTIYMNGSESKLFYILKTIASEKQNYNVTVYHKNCDTICDICHHGVTKENGSISFDITNIIEKEMKNTVVNQENRIITNNSKMCKICPNLIVDEQDVVANHSAHLGDVNEDELFYLESRGIDVHDAKNLLIQGFLLEKIEEYKEKIKDYITFEWR